MIQEHIRSEDTMAQN